MLRIPFTRTMASESTAQGPLELLIRSKLTTALQPSLFQLHNDSRLHAHHAAMANSSSPETHFRLTLVSDQFDGLKLAQRHRLVYGLLKEEVGEGKVHALQMRLKTRGEQVRDEEQGKGNASKPETCRNTKK